ncbi:MAG: hypothetical protein ACF8QF_01885 [Phycisphaerales bacterium]
MPLARLVVGAVAPLLTVAVALGATPAERRADLEAAASALWDTHPYLSREVDRADWNEALGAIEASLDEIDDAGFFLAISRLCAMAHDGHTSVVPGRVAFMGVSYPVRFRMAQDGLVVMDAAPEYAASVGGRVVSLYDTPVEELFASLADDFPGDNPIAGAGWTEIFIRFPIVMRAAGFAPGDDLGTTMVVETATGEERSFALAPSPPGDPRVFGPAPEGWTTIRDAWPEPPRAESRPGERHWFAAIDDGRALYVRYAEVQDDDDETIAQFAERLWAFAAEDQSIERIVFDVRGNGGGNNYLNQPLILGLVRSRFDEPGRSFCLIDRDTFSAAMNFVGELERLTHTIFVGEPTGAGPNHAGDNESFALEHSGLTLRVSQLWWQFSDPRDPRRWVRPDIAAPLTIADWRTAHDPGLEAIRAVGEVPAHLTGQPVGRWRRLTQRREWQGMVGGFQGAWHPGAPVTQ